MKIISPGVVALRPFKIHTNALTQDDTVGATSALGKKAAKAAVKK